MQHHGLGGWRKRQPHEGDTAQSWYARAGGGCWASSDGCWASSDASLMDDGGVPPPQPQQPRQPRLPLAAMACRRWPALRLRLPLGLLLLGLLLLGSPPACRAPAAYQASPIADPGPGARQSHSAAGINGSGFIFGGEDAGGTRNDLWQHAVGRGWERRGGAVAGQRAGVFSNRG
eukprot:COSAG04_NODE_1103_length_8239_cov_138.727518_4_plen_174_part_01